MHGRELLRAKVAETSLTEVAGRLGVTRWAVSRWIGDGTQQRSPDLESAIALDRELGIPVSSWGEEKPTVDAPAPQEPAPVEAS